MVVIAEKRIFRTGVFAVMLGLASCSGSSTTIEQINSQTQQLLDLKEAHEKGVITDEEYEQTRARVLEQN